MDKEITMRGKTSPFEQIKHVENGEEYWLARELGTALGYTKWDSFKKVVKRAEISLSKSGLPVENHFSHVGKMVSIGYNNKQNERLIDDVRLTRYACYIIAQNGNPTKKPRIAEAQNYFATQTRKQELMEEYESDMNRLSRRQEFSNSDKHLSANILEAGVSPRGLASIKSQGDKHFFGGKSSSDIKKQYGLSKSKPWADRAPNVVLAGKTLANEMTAANIENYPFSGYAEIMNDNNDNNLAVRKTIVEQQGRAPEDFPPAEDTNVIKRRVERRDMLNSGNQIEGNLDATNSVDDD